VPARSALKSRIIFVSPILSIFCIFPMHRPTYRCVSRFQIWNELHNRLVSTKRGHKLFFNQSKRFLDI
jgi:hypothetical protein